MFSYQNFMAFVRSNGLSRQNRFYLNMGQPNVFMDAGIDTRNFFCKSVSIPGVNVASETLRLTGEAIEVPYDRNFSQLSLTFYVDTNLQVRRYFDHWIDRIQNPNTRVMTFYNEYVTDIEVFVLDINDNKRYKMTCYECWPKSIGALTIDNETTGTMMLDVTFEFRYYKTNVLMSRDYQLVADRQRRMLRQNVGGLGFFDSLLPEKYRGIIFQNPANVAQYVNDPTAMNLIVNDPIAMNSIYGSDSALGAIGNSPTAVGEMRNSPAHSIGIAPNLVMGVANSVFDTYQLGKYISTGISLDITEAKDTLLRLDDLRKGSITPASLGAATQGVFNSTSALGTLVAPLVGPVTVTPTGQDVGGSNAFVGLFRV